MAAKTKHARVVDRYLISSQSWEITTVRARFYKVIAGYLFSHPAISEVKELIKQFNNSRKKVYAELRKMGYTQV